jgi:uncharacterized protein (DUF1330 family)|tara:strand:- start:395 stop:691 length:297 start_codon:yes stop_codon:yes gene_type:complete
VKGYWIALYTKIENLDNLKKYAEAATPVIKKYGGIPLVRGGKYKVLSGDEFPRTVIWEFPSFQKAINCHDSKEYLDGWALAKNTTIRNLQIVEGFNTE